MTKQNNYKRNKLFDWGKLRKLHYFHQGKVWKKIEFNNWLKNPYTAFKSTFYIETSVLIVYFAQFTRITPNHLTFVYIIFGLVGGLFLASDNNFLIILSLFLFFIKGSFDWADGLLARIKNQTSNLGNLLDHWGAKVGYLSFLIGFGYYLYNKNNEETFLFLIILIILLKAIDLKDYSYHLTMYEFMKDKNRKNFLNKLNFSKNNFSKKGFNPLVFLKNFFQNFVDDRARSIDLIMLLILIDNFYYELIFLKFIFYYISFKVLVIFLGGFYATIFKKFLLK